jgi:hypothetical protein
MKGCGFRESVKKYERTNAAGGFTHWYPLDCEVESNRSTGIGGLGFRVTRLRLLV